MASFDIGPGLDNFIKELERFGADEPEIAKAVVTAGAQPVADEIRNKMQRLPVDKFRRLSKDEQFDVLTKDQKEDLLNSFGITPAGVDKAGNTNVKIGFSGYGKHKSKKYPKGLPNALLARAVESGSSVRKKIPFVRLGTDKARPIAIKKMQEKINEEVRKYKI